MTHAKKTGFSLKRLLSLALATAMLLSLTLFSAGAVPNSDYEARTSLQPYGHQFHLSELMNWSPDSDPDARYNISKVPLAERYTGNAVNTAASPLVRVNNTSISNQMSSKAPSQGSDSSDVYSFTYWQYVSTYTYWGGSGGEGIFCIPTGEVIDSAHKNGVPITGTVFFPQDGTTTAWLKSFASQAADGSYPVADKMLEMAEYYGFDGYFFNEETSGFNSTDATNVRKAMQYMEDNKPNEDFILIWYDSMTIGGGVSWQNQLNANNGAFLQEGDKRTSDYMFLNFGWNTTYIANSVNYAANTLGRSPFDVLATWDVQGNAYNTNFTNRAALRGTDGKPRISLGFYCPNSTLNMAKNADDFLNEHEYKFWTGSNGDPSVSNTATSGNWNGVAQFAADRTAATTLPFATNFNTGLGFNYYQNGVLTRPGDWSNRSMQDLLPTWRWTVVSTGTKLTPSFDLTDAYNGGTSLKLAGNLSAGRANLIKLYSTKLELEDDKDYYLSVTAKGLTDSLDFRVGLYTAADYSAIEYVTLPSRAAGVWVTDKIALTGLSGKTVYGIALEVGSAAAASNVKINVGRIAIAEDASVEELPAPATATLDDYLVHDAKNAEARVYWDEVTGENFDHYNLYQVTVGGARRYLGSVINNAYYIDSLLHDPASDDVVVEIVPVDKLGTESANTCRLIFDYTMGLAGTEVDETPPPVNLALNSNVTANGQLSGEPAPAAVDGNYLSKWCYNGGTSGWLRIDFGAPTTVQRWAVEHAGATEGVTMNTVDFSLEWSNTGGSAASEWTEVMRIRDNWENHTDFNLETPVTARYFRLRIYQSDRSPWRAIRIYEFELYEEPYTPKTPNLSMENAKVKDGVAYFKNVDAGLTLSVYDALDAEQPLRSVFSTGGVITFDGLDLNPAGGRLYYDVCRTDWLRSDRLSVPFDARDAEKTPLPAARDIGLNAVRIARDPEIATTNPNANYNFAVLEVKAANGSVTNLYTAAGDVFGTKWSAPATNSLARIEATPLSKAGGYIRVTMRAPGYAESDPFRVYFKANGAYDEGRTELQMLTDYVQANVLAEEQYSIQSWKAYVEALEAALPVPEDSAVSDKDVQIRLQSLKDAYGGLTPRATDLKITGPVSVTVKKGKTAPLGFTYNGGDENIRFISSNPSVATVTNDGVVKGVKTGMAIITAYTVDGSNLYSYTVVNVIA